jgi:hypothetical protein
VEPRRLDHIVESTPHTFRTWLVNPADRERAEAAVAARLRGATVTFVAEPDGRVRLDLVSSLQPRATAILQPLRVLRHEGIAVTGFESDDLVFYVGEAELREVVESEFSRRLEALAGNELLARLIDGWRDDSRDGRSKRALGRSYRAAAMEASLNTTGSERVMLQGAHDTPDGREASWYVTAAIRRANLCSAVGLPFDAPEATVLALCRRRDPAGESGIDLVIAAEVPLTEELTQVLCRAATQPGNRALHALNALRRATRTAELRATLERAVESKDPDVSGVALRTYATVFGAGARHVWESFLESRSALRRLDGEDVIGEFGGAEDVPRAATYLRKFIRTRPSTETIPPRGSAIIGLLVRQRHLPEARSGLEDLTARWERLQPALRQWIVQHHPDLAPIEDGEATAASAGEDDTVPETDLMWPMPTLEREGGSIRLEFAEMDHAVRDRFGELLEADPAFRILDGDREWLTLTSDTSDPDAVIADLWRRAHLPDSGRSLFGDHPAS